MSVVAAAVVGSAVVGAYTASNQADQAADAQASADRANATSAGIAQQQQDIANAQWDSYKTNYLPLEQDYLESAKGYGSIANQDKAATNAAASATASFAGARDQLNKTPGLDPNSQQYLREVNRLGISEAAASAAGQTAARQGVADKGAAMVQDAASLGKGVAGNAVSSLNAAAATTAGVASGATSAANAAYGRANATAGGIGQMVGGLAQSGSLTKIGNWASGLFAPQTNVVNGVSLNTATPSATMMA